MSFFCDQILDMTIERRLSKLEQEFVKEIDAIEKEIKKYDKLLGYLGLFGLLLMILLYAGQQWNNSLPLSDEELRRRRASYAWRVNFVNRWIWHMSEFEQFLKGLDRKFTQAEFEFNKEMLGIEKAFKKKEVVQFSVTIVVLLIVLGGLVYFSQQLRRLDWTEKDVTEEFVRRNL